MLAAGRTYLRPLKKRFPVNRFNFRSRYSGRTQSRKARPTESLAAMRMKVNKLICVYLLHEIIIPDSPFLRLAVPSFASLPPSPALVRALRGSTMDPKSVCRMRGAGRRWLDALYEWTTRPEAGLDASHNPVSWGRGVRLDGFPLPKAV